MATSIYSKYGFCTNSHVHQKKKTNWLSVNFDGKFPDLNGYWLWLPKDKKGKEKMVK